MANNTQKALTAPIGVVGVEPVRVATHEIADELKHPATPKICHQQIEEGEGDLAYKLFQKWLLTPLKDFTPRSLTVTLNNQRYDCADLAMRFRWHVRAQAFDVARAQLMPDLMASLTTYAPIIAMGSLLKAMTRSDAKPSDVIKAAAEILDRTGHGKTIKLPVPPGSQPPEEMTTAELIEMIKNRVSSNVPVQLTAEQSIAEPLPIPTEHPQLMDGVYLPKTPAELAESAFDDEDEEVLLNDDGLTPPIGA